MPVSWLHKLSHVKCQPILICSMFLLLMQYQQANFFATPAVPTTSAQSFGHVQSGFPPQLQPQLQPQAQAQAQQTPGSDRLQAPTSVSGRTRREIPQVYLVAMDSGDVASSYVGIREVLPCECNALAGLRRIGMLYI